MFIADSDYLPNEEAEYEGNPPGRVSYTFSPELILKAFGGESQVEQEFVSDQWGDTSISAYIPIIDGPIMKF